MDCVCLCNMGVNPTSGVQLFQLSCCSEIGAVRSISVINSVLKIPCPTQFPPPPTIFLQPHTFLHLGNDGSIHIHCCFSFYFNCCVHLSVISVFWVKWVLHTWNGMTTILVIIFIIILIVFMFIIQPHQCHTKRLQPTKIPALKSRVVKSLPHLPARPSSASSCKSQLAQNLDRLSWRWAEPI